ncbi:hypothetical protein MK805_17415 [Shimazuella sp. AN120528]|uniref:hypothetical protein n=1 Tax=Shimazuella soli TaxID=1892854 RepID=UPI001F0EDB57|nr:hypothetical protein [Shimazuella soli]MCH5586712.1 hypothetical protein [Shimazuella soli]
MSFPNIPNITPKISLSENDSISLLLSSIALEELALAHIVNAEAEKIQFVLGTLPGTKNLINPPYVTISDLLTINTDVRKTLQDVIKKEMLLQFKLENILQLKTTSSTSSTTTTTSSTTTTTTTTTKTTTTTSTTSTTTTTTSCGCMVTNPAGESFNITRGTGANDTTVVFNGVTQPTNAHGSVNFCGHICLTCTSNNQFIFDYGGSATIRPFRFTATTFHVPHCKNQVVTITGEGNTTNTALFGPNPVSYTLDLNGITNNKRISLLITGSNGSVFFATISKLGNHELSVTNCP